MKFLNNKMLIAVLLAVMSGSNLVSTLSASANAAIKAEATRTPENVEAERGGDDDCFEVTELKVNAIGAKKLRAKCIDAYKIDAYNVCAENSKSKQICADKITVNCEASAPKLSADYICANYANTKDLCVTGTAKISKLEVCGVYRATAVYSVDTTITLGTPLAFDDILDDPNHNIISTSPTTYQAPVSGYYIVTLQVDTLNLAGTSIIAGIPVGDLRIWVNGQIYRESFVPYLSFHPSTAQTLSALISLKAGDLVASDYNVLVLTDSGFSPYVGTVTSLGNGTEANRSFFKIHYLSSDCNGQPLCNPCCPDVDYCKPECKPCKPECKPECKPCKPGPKSSGK